jgi:hypothetical protein
MAGNKHEAQEIVADLVIKRGVKIGRRRFLLDFESVAEFPMLALQQLVAAEEIDRPMFCSGHEPGTGLVGDTRPRPLVKRGDERVLRKFLGEIDIPYDPRQAGDQLCLLDPEDCIDHAMCIVSRHDSRSHHLHSVGAS